MDSEPHQISLLQLSQGERGSIDRFEVEAESGSDSDSDSDLN